ncbi:MAG: hypothetical protein JSU77_03460 [Fidelibacterota bacterium]|nr:MAG: hypothetical protein JSU77_03460 [Candidatus Neomarinimicrobiota bacterium]
MRVLLIALSCFLLANCETPLDDNNNSDNDTTDTPIDTTCLFVDTTGACTDLPIAAKLYVANTGDNTVSVVDIATQQVITTLAVGERPVAVSVQSELGLVYVACRDDKSVWVIDTDVDTVKRIINLPGHAIHITAGSNEMAYVIVDHDSLLFGDEYVCGITHHEGDFVDSLYFESPICTSLRYLIYHSAGILFGLSEIWETCEEGPPHIPFVANILTGEVIHYCSIRMINMALSGNEEYLYTLGEWGSYFKIYDVNTIDEIDLIFIPSEHDLTYIYTFTPSCTGRILYLAFEESNQVLAFDLCEFTVIDTAIFNAPADKIILLEREGLLIASQPGSDAVAFFNLDTGTLEREIAIGHKPVSMAVLKNQH